MKRVWWLLACLILSTLAILFHARWLPALAKYLDVGEAPRKSDYIMIMGGGVENRPFTAAALYKKGWADRILIAELRPTPGGENLLPPEHEVASRLLQKLGVPEDQIVILDGNHAATFHEIVTLGELLAREPEAKVMIVTDTVHTRRTRWSVERILGLKASRVSFVSAPCDGYTLETWWQNGQGFFMVTSEYLKLVFYAFRYGWGLHLTGAVIGLILVIAAVARYLRVRGRREIAPTQAVPTP